MPIRTHWVAVLALAGGLVLGGGERQARAEPLLYGVEGTVLTGEFPRLVTIPTSGPFVVTAVGSLGVAFVHGGLAYDPSSATLYGVDNVTPDGNLYTIDVGTGAATLVGPLNISPLVGDRDLRGLAFDTKNVVLYGGAGAGVPGDLYALNVNTGSATHIGELPFPTPEFQLGGLAYDSSRDMLVGLDLGTADLYVIDRTTPANSTLLYENVVATTRIDGLTYDSVHDLLWAADAVGRLHSYDPNDGYTRTLHPLGPGREIASLAFITDPVGVPALSEWLLLVATASLLLTVAILGRRSSARATSGPGAQGK